MALIEPRIIALDSSQWANWLDDALRPGRARRGPARNFHRRLLDEGLIPLFSWHHLEELLAIADARLARDRLAFIDELPLVAWLSIGEETGPGGIIHILAAEAIALLKGAQSLRDVRDCARTLLLRTGTGSHLLGPDLWVWNIVRAAGQRRREKHQLLATLRPITLFDEQRTVGDIAKGSIRPENEYAAIFRKQRDALSQEISQHGDQRIVDPGSMADRFYTGVAAFAPVPGMTVRQLIEATLVARGIDLHEITDDRILADLSELATFRSQLEVIAQLTGTTVQQLKTLSPAVFPHHRLDKALRDHGQRRNRRPASDVTDGHLASLALYCRRLYVDKRTAEDLRRALGRDRMLSGLIGEIVRTGDYAIITR